MIKTILCSLFLLLFIPKKTFSDDYDTFLINIKEAWSTYRNIANFSVYEPSYFIIAPAPMLFQMSFSYRIWGPYTDIKKNDTGFYFAFTMKAIFDQKAGGNLSRPFVDTNYMPEGYYLMDFPDAPWFNAKFGYRHNSNGKGAGGTLDNRANNELYFEPIFYALGRNLQIRLRVYTSFDLASNLDYLNTVGMFRLIINHRYLIQDKVGIENSLIINKGFDWDKGSLEWDFSIGPFIFGKFYFPVAILSQVFVGYGETLLFHQKAYAKWRIGVRFTFN